MYALAFAIPFGSLYELHIGPLTVGPSELLVGVVMLCYALRLLAARRVASLRQPSWLWLGVGVYIATLTISLLPAGELLLGLKGVLKWLEVLVLYGLVATQLSARQRQVLVACLLLAGAAQALLGVNQFLRQIGPPGFVLFGRYMRAYGTFEQPNPFGGYLGMILPLGYGLLLAGMHDAELGKRMPWLRWSFVAGSSALLLAGLLMSWSRGALLGVIGGLALVGLVVGRRYWPLAALLAATVVVFAPELLALTNADWLTRLTDLTTLIGRDLAAVEITDANFANVERLAHWVAGWRMFEHAPWLGVGTGQYPVVYETVAVPRWREALGHAHNYYLHVMAEGGLLGLAGYLAMMIGATVAVGRRAVERIGWARGVALGALGMLGHLWLHSLVDNLYVHELYLLVAMVLGLATASQAVDERQSTAPFTG